MKPSLNKSTLRLAEADLDRSGLTLQQVSADGIFPVDDESLVNPAFAASPALIIPYRDRRGQPVMYSSEQNTLPFVVPGICARQG